MSSGDHLPERLLFCNNCPKAQTDSMCIICDSPAEMIAVLTSGTRRVEGQLCSICYLELYRPNETNWLATKP